MSAPEPMSYIATHACGGWVLVTVDLPERAKDNAKEIAKCIRAGYTISRVPVEDIRSRKVVMCECGRKKRKAEATQQEMAIGR